jgi:hypothetical protein
VLGQPHARCSRSRTASRRAGHPGPEDHRRSEDHHPEDDHGTAAGGGRAGEDVDPLDVAANPSRAARDDVRRRVRCGYRDAEASVIDIGTRRRPGVCGDTEAVRAAGHDWINQEPIRQEQRGRRGRL